ncbi:MAG: hypothetical protein ACF8LL_02085 [Phycisphaerales bacterium]
MATKRQVVKVTPKKGNPKPPIKKATPKKPQPEAEAAADSPPADPKARIAELLSELEGATMPGKKKALRRQLRSLGHTGGLRKPKAPPQKKA